MYKLVKENATKVAISGLMATTLLVPLSVPLIAEAVETREVARQHLEIESLQTAGRVGDTTSEVTIRQHASWSNTNNRQYTVPNSRMVTHLGGRAFCGDSWGHWEHVRTIDIANNVRTGWIHGDNIRWR